MVAHGEPAGPEWCVGGAGGVVWGTRRFLRHLFYEPREFRLTNLFCSVE